MNLSDADLRALAESATQAALAAAALINAHRDQDVAVSHKDVGTTPASQVVTEVDHKAQAAILEVLEPISRKWDLAILTEESPDDGARQEKQAFWCIDPMDGTLAFVRGISGMGVSIGLVARNGSPLVGVVADPTTDTLYHAIRGQGAFRDGAPITPPELSIDQPLVMQTDLSFEKHPLLNAARSGLDEIATSLGLPGSEIQFRIGAVLNACDILDTPNRCYFKYPRTSNSGGSLWDYAATACLFKEVGAIATDIHGAPMDLNRSDSTFMNHRGVIYATDARLAEKIRAMYEAQAT